MQNKTVKNRVKINVRLYYGLREYTSMGQDRFDLHLDEENNIRDLMNTIRLSRKEEIVAVVNDRLADRDTRLSDGDTVSLFPAPTGG
jgi:molybdopterin converting factor small subunit